LDLLLTTRSHHVDAQASPDNRWMDQPLAWILFFADDVVAAPHWEAQVDRGAPTFRIGRSPALRSDVSCRAARPGYPIAAAFPARARSAPAGI